MWSLGTCEGCGGEWEVRPVDVRIAGNHEEERLTLCDRCYPDCEAA